MKTKFSELNTKEAIPVLNDIGDKKTANDLAKLLAERPDLERTKISELPDSVHLERATWRGEEHAYGYIAIDNDNDDFFELEPATTIEPDRSLMGQLVNIKLGSLYTMNYPGGGRHNVLMHFKCRYAKENSDDTALIDFNQKFRSKEGEGAGDIGNFIFLGLRVPKNGLQFEVQTVNVSNDNDENALKVLESGPIKNGLNLIDTTFSSIAPFTKMAQGVLGLLLARNRNKTVQQFTIGFDFTQEATEIAKLKIGTYVAVQVKKNDLNWNEWVYKRSVGLIVNKNDNSIRLPYNHITFNILKHH